MMRSYLVQTVECGGRQYDEMAYEDEDILADETKVSYFTVDVNETSGMQLHMTLINLDNGTIEYANVVCTSQSFKVSMLEAISEVYKAFSPHKWLVTNCKPIENEPF